MIHLDTNVLIGALVSGSAADLAVRRWLSNGESIGLSSIAWSEFLCGPPHGGVSTSTRDAARELLGEAVPFDRYAAELTADLYNLTGRRRGSLVDCMVAAVAIANGASLATANIDDFSLFQSAGLTLLHVV
jgi:predicted nucleic acid-binding protein